MNKKKLQPKRALRTALLVLLLCAVGMTNALAEDYDFSSVCSTGQTLYYRITNYETHEVQLTYPNMSTDYWHTGPDPRWYDYHYEHLYWKNYERPTGDIVVPYYVEHEGISYSVTSIRDHTFGNHNFQNNSGHNYYYYDQCTDITSILIPSSVITIGDDAFARCTGLNSVNIPVSVNTIGEYVFYNCSNLVTVNINATNWISAGNAIWSGCSSLTNINLGNTVTRIPDNGFQGATALASVTLPNSLTTIGSYGFEGCTSLTTVTCGSGSTLATIGDYAFQNCSQLATINLPNTLTTIGNYAFNGCSLLQSTTEEQLLPNALESIGDYAFQNATTLAYIRIPSTLTSLGKYAFKGCTALNTVDYEATNCTYSGTQAEPPFYGCAALATVTVSDNVNLISDYCFKDCTSIVNLTINEGLSEIGSYAFYGCYNINPLVLPASITAIGSYAFGNSYDIQLAHVESYNVIPPTIGGEMSFPMGQTIYVPQGSVEDYQSANYWSDYTIVGMVMPNTFTISVSSDPANAGTVSGGGTYENGQTCTLTATPAEGYTFMNWTNNGTPVSANASYSFTVTENASYVAHFVQNSYQISAMADPTIGGTISGDGVYNYGASCTLTATPNTNYSFVYWTKNGAQVSTEANYTFEVTESATYVAHFQPSYTITVIANPSAGGSFSGDGVYLQGQSCTITATSADGYAFINWTKNGILVTTQTTYTFTVTESATYIAHFQAQSFVIATSANPTDGGSITGGGTFAYGENCTVTAIPNTGFTFVNWTENGNPVSNNQSYTFTVTTDHNLVANFTSQNYVITAIASPTDGGVVTGAGGYNSGDICTLSATASIGFTFQYWTKNGVEVSTTPTFSFNVTESATYVAHFLVQTYSISVSVDPVEGGVVVGGGMYYYGQSCTINVMPNGNYSFDSWTEDGVQVSTNASYTFIVTDNHSFVAHLQYVDGVDEDNNVRTNIFPNPVKDKLTIEASEPINLLEIYNITGALMYRHMNCNETMEINVENYSMGIYLIRMTTNNKVETKKFVKE